MAPILNEVVRTVRTSGPELTTMLSRLVRIPSVSSQAEHAGDVGRAARLVAQLMRDVGMPQVQVVATEGHPVVVGCWPRTDRPTVLVYGHYDVQPADADQWTSDPFTPTRRGPWLHGRGASDDKGQLLAHLTAVGAWGRVAGQPPVGLVVLADGEEEIGSPNLGPIVREAASRVDAAVVSDMTMPGIGRPALTESLRGKVALDVVVSNGGVDAHSGLFGGAVADPAAWLCGALAGLHDAGGTVTVDGFYDDVRPAPTGQVHARSDAAIRNGAGGASLWPEAGFSADEATTVRPALVVSSLASGLDRSAVVPSTARARLELRLVADQQPGTVAALVRDHLRTLTPPELHVTVAVHLGAGPARFDRRGVAATAAQRALRAAFGRPPVWVRSGGTIPVVAQLHRLGVPCVLAGFGLPTSRVHGPDERAHLPTLLRGAEFSARWFDEIGGRTLRRAEQAYGTAVVRGRRTDG